MDKIVKLICMYVEKNLLKVIRPEPNMRLYQDFVLFARYAYENRTAQTCSTALLRELLKCKLNPSAHRGFWQTFDTLVGDTFSTYLSNIISKVVDTPSEYGVDIPYIRKHFIEQQLKEMQPRTLPEEIRWFLAKAIQDYICSIATDAKYELLLEICSGDFGQPYIEHLLTKNDDVDDFINRFAQVLLR